MTDRTLLARAVPWMAMLSCLVLVPAGRAADLPSGDLEQRCWLSHTRDRTRINLRETTSVDFANLRSGYAVRAPFEVGFAVRGMGVAPAGVKFDGTGHHHILVDRAMPASVTDKLPFDDSHRHFGKGQTGTEAVRGVYVRKSDSNNVVLYEPERGWMRSVQTEVWLDKVLAKLQLDKVNRFTLQNAATGQPVTFVRQDGKASWTAVEPPPGIGAVRQGEVEALLQRLRWIGAQDFRMPLQRANLVQLGLQPPQIRIELVVREGDRDRKLELGIGNRVDDKAEYYLTCNESAFLMTWPAGNVVPFEADGKALFDPAAPTDPGKADENKPADEKKDGEKKEEKKPG